MENQSSIGQGTVWNPGGSHFIDRNLSKCPSVLAASSSGKEEKEKRTRRPAVLRPKSERDCRFCCEGKGKPPTEKRELPVSWQLRKGRGGRNKIVKTERYFCPNQSIAYYGITEEDLHALVGFGKHGRHESIQDFKCQACGKKFTARRNTILYRLKSHSGLIEKILRLLALGVCASA
jgi:hypothetical protein